MLSRISQIRNRLIPILSGQAIGLVCGILGVHLTSAWISPEVFGRYGVFLSFTTIGMWVVYAGVIKYITRHWAGVTEKAQLSRVVFRHWVKMLPWLLGGALAAALATSLLTANSFGFTLLPLFFAASLLALVAIIQAALQAAREHWRDCAVSTTGSISRTFAPLLLFLVIGHSAGLYLGFCVHAAVTLFVGWWVLRHQLRPSAISKSAPVVIDPLYTGSLFTMLAVTSWALSGTNRWITAALFGEEQAGFFMLASNIVMIIPTLIGTLLLQLFQPDLFALGDRQDSQSPALLMRKVDHLVAGLVTLSLCGVFGLHLIMPSLTGWLINETYLPARQWIVPAGCAGISLMMGNYYQSMLMAGKKEKACGPVTYCGAIVFIGGSVAAGLGGRFAFMIWLTATPLVLGLLTRYVSRRYFLSAA
jgi:O-antigen/teichoic acid export membrane protein